jgi:sortase A
MERTRADRIVQWMERGLAVLGTVCLTWVGATTMKAVTYQRKQNEQFARLATSTQQTAANRRRDLAPSSPEAPVLIGRLEIPRVGLSAIVMEGDDDNTLNVAVGHLPDTPLPWQEGNTALAGHRDTFFRALGRVQVGDGIDLETRQGTFRYRVTHQMVVEPDDLWVLEPSQATALTLITCYPFNFVGSAPRRFVVHAERIAERTVAPQASTGPSEGHDELLCSTESA